MVNRNGPRDDPQQDGAQQRPLRRSKRILDREGGQRAEPTDGQAAVEGTLRHSTKRKRNARDEGIADVQGSNRPRKRAGIQHRAPEV